MPEQKALLIDRLGVIREVGNIPSTVDRVIGYGSGENVGNDMAIVKYNPLSTDAEIMGLSQSGFVTYYYDKVNSSPINDYLVYTHNGELEALELRSLLTWYQAKVAEGLSNLNAVSEIPDSTYDIIKENIPIPPTAQPEPEPEQPELPIYEDEPEVPEEEVLPEPEPEVTEEEEDDFPNLFDQEYIDSLGIEEDE